VRYITFTPSGGAEEEATLQRFGTFQPLLIFGWFRDYKNLPVPLKINRFKSRASTTTSQTPPASKHYYNMPGASCCLSNVVKQAMQFVVGLLLLCFQMGACTRVLAHVHIHLHRLQACLLGDCLSLHTASDRYIHHALARSQQRYSWKACQGKQAHCWLYVLHQIIWLMLLALVTMSLLQYYTWCKRWGWFCCVSQFSLRQQAKIFDKKCCLKHVTLFCPYSVRQRGSQEEGWGTSNCCSYVATKETRGRSRKGSEQ